MIEKYNSFLKINEANVKTKITRDDLKIGDHVMTHGEFDGVGLDYEVGKIIAMKDYGNILIEFDNPFSKKFHAGHKDIGKPGHCFYIPLDNISTNNRAEFEKIIKGVGEEKKNRQQRINTTYKEGDVIVGIGEINTGYQKNKIDGEVGIVYYENGQGGLDQKDRGDYKIKYYWVGFLDKFDTKYMRADGEGLPTNGAGMNVDSIHMRHITREEQELIEDKIKPLKKQIDALKAVYEVGTIVIVDGNYGGIALDHFDTLRTFDTTNNYLTNGNANWKRPNPLPKVDAPKIAPDDVGPRATTAKKEDTKTPELNSKVQYKKDGAPHDGKTGTFVGIREDDGKYKIVFDDGKKLAANPKNVYPAPADAGGIKPLEEKETL